MGIADDFMRSFYEHYPEAKNGTLTFPELNKLLAKFQDKVNYIPEVDFDGLSPAQMNALLYQPLSVNSTLQFNKAMGPHLEQVPLFQLSELLLKEIKDAGKLKLTVKGNLPVRLCALLFNRDLIKWQYMMFVRIREEEIPYMTPLKFYLLEQGIIKKRNNALSLTKNGEKFMEESKAARFINLFNFFAARFHWGNFYMPNYNSNCGQLGWAYSLVLLGKYGDKARENEFYSFKLMQAFEKNLWNQRETKAQEEKIKIYHRAYASRFFEHFANWFGLVNIERKKNLPSIFHQLIISKSALFDLLFEPITDVHQ